MTFDSRFVSKESDVIFLGMMGQDFFFLCVSKDAGLWISIISVALIEGSIFVLKDNRNCKIGCWLDEDDHTQPIKLCVQLNHYGNFKWHFLQTLTNWSLNSYKNVRDPAEKTISPKREKLGNFHYPLSKTHTKLQ